MLPGQDASVHNEKTQKSTLKFKKRKFKEKSRKNTIFGQLENNLDVAHLHQIMDLHAKFNDSPCSGYMKGGDHQNQFFFKYAKNTFSDQFEK